MVEELTKATGVSKILVADSDALVGFLPERLAPIVLASQNQFNYTHIVGMFSEMMIVLMLFIVIVIVIFEHC